MDQDLKAKYDSLPEDIKSAVQSSDALLKLEKIGKKHGLLIDKIGILETEVAAVMLGETHPDEFVDTLEETLGISTEGAIELATDVNIEIFLPLRESLMKIHGSEDDTATEPIVEKPDSREDILAEIENPTPVAHPISAVDQTVPGPAKPREIVEREAMGSAHNFIAQNLAGTSQAPAQTAAIELKKKEPEKPKNYTADPYRESI